MTKLMTNQMTNEIVAPERNFVPSSPSSRLHIPTPSSLHLPVSRVNVNGIGLLSLSTVKMLACGRVDRASMVP